MRITGYTISFGRVIDILDLPKSGVQHAIMLLARERQLIDKSKRSTTAALLLKALAEFRQTPHYAYLLKCMKNFPVGEFFPIVETAYSNGLVGWYWDDENQLPIQDKFERLLEDTNRLTLKLCVANSYSNWDCSTKYIKLEHVYGTRNLLLRAKLKSTLAMLEHLYELA